MTGVVCLGILVATVIARPVVGLASEGHWLSSTGRTRLIPDGKHELAEVIPGLHPLVRRDGL